MTGLLPIVGAMVGGAALFALYGLIVLHFYFKGNKNKS